jgi:hypothetical protein
MAAQTVAALLADLWRGHLTAVNPVFIVELAPGQRPGISAEADRGKLRH